MTLIRIDGEVIQSKRQQNRVGFVIVRWDRRSDFFGSSSDFIMFPFLSAIFSMALLSGLTHALEKHYTGPKVYLRTMGLELTSRHEAC